MANELKNTLKVDDIEFNINAVQANKVTNKLTVNKVTLSNTKSKLIDFDGSATKTLDIVPADGGAFTGRIKVPNNTNSTVEDEAVLNYGDLRNKVLNQLINNSTIFSWSGSTLSVPTAGSSTIAGMSLVQGTEANVQRFANSNKNNATAVPNNNNASKRWLAAYLYICSDTKNIYFGTSDKATATRLASEAKALKETVKRNNKSVTIDYTALDIEAIESNVNKIINGTISVGKATSIDCGNNQIIAGTALNSTLNSLNSTTSTNSANIAALQSSVDKIIDGATTVGKATTATTATTAATAMKATIAEKDSNENIISSYYQKRITLSTSAPSNSSNQGNNGDIWIKYSTAPI